MIDTKLTRGLEYIAKDSKLLDEFLGEMPNVKMKTMGGTIFWKDIAECNGFKLQENLVVGHCRLLDQNNSRIAWGGKSAMETALCKIINKAKETE